MPEVPYDIEAQTVEVGALGSYAIVGKHAGWGIHSRDGMVDVQSPFASQAYGSFSKETQDRLQVRHACDQLRKTTSRPAPEAVRAGAAMWLFQRDVRQMGHYVGGWSFHPLCRGFNYDAQLPDISVHSGRDELRISLRVHLLCEQVFVDLAFVDMWINHHTGEVRVRSNFAATNELEKALCTELQVFAGRLAVADAKTQAAREHLLARLAWLNVTL